MSERTWYEITHDGEAIKCLCCGRESWHPEDVRNRYCGHCACMHDLHVETCLEIRFELEHVIKEAGGIYSNEGVDIWIDAPNRMLENKTPREMVQERRTQEVLNLIEAIGEGVFF